MTETTTETETKYGEQHFARDTKRTVPIEQAARDWGGEAAVRTTAEQTPTVEVEAKAKEAKGLGAFFSKIFGGRS